MVINMVELSSDELRILKQKEMVILERFHTFCLENNIKYSLAYGTLLGAVRHKGFIPWDDDIDVMMTRDNYEKFCSCFKNDNYFFLQTNKTDPGYYYPFAKLRLNNTIFKEEVLSLNKIHHGVYIDIFVLDDVPINKRSAKKHIRKVRLLKAFVNAKFYKINSLHGSSKVFYFILKLILSFVSIKFLYKKLIKNTKMKFNGSTHCRDYFEKNENQLINKNVMDNLMLMQFENGQYYAVKDFDTVLTGFYGNYMKLPPLEERVPHHSIEELNLEDAKCSK